MRRMRRRRRRRGQIKILRSLDFHNIFEPIFICVALHTGIQSLVIWFDAMGNTLGRSDGKPL